MLRLRTGGPGRLTGLDLPQQGPLRRIWGIALASHLQHKHVSARMAASASSALADAGLASSIAEYDDASAPEPGAGLALFADLDGGARIGADATGATGRPAERIGLDAAGRLAQDLRSGATVDRYLADQIVMFAALADGVTRLRLPGVSQHLRTALWLAEQFGLCRPHLEDHLLTITGASLPNPERHGQQASQPAVVAAGTLRRNVI